MYSARVDSINRSLRRYHSGVYAVYRGEGMIHICTPHVGWEVHPDALGEQCHLVVSRKQDQFLFALTDNWKVTGRPVEWGILPILARIRAHDLASHPELFEEMLQSYEKDDESRARDLHNNVESFLYDYRREFARQFKDVNTSTVNKLDRRRKFDGYR